MRSICSKKRPLSPEISFPSAHQAGAVYLYSRSCLARVMFRFQVLFEPLIGLLLHRPSGHISYRKRSWDFPFRAFPSARSRTSPRGRCLSCRFIINHFSIMAWRQCRLTISGDPRCHRLIEKYSMAYGFKGLFPCARLESIGETVSLSYNSDSLFWVFLLLKSSPPTSIPLPKFPCGKIPS